MNLSQTLQLLQTKEKATGALLRQALELKRHRNRSHSQILHASDAYSLRAVNPKARIKWGRVFVRNIYNFFRLTDDDDALKEAVFLVTLADKSHLTTEQPQKINLPRIKRKLGGALQGLSYIGMIEPGYYNVIYEMGEQRKNIISWHGHFLVWGVTDKQLAAHLKRAKCGIVPILPERCAVHKKTIAPDQFSYKLWYIIKSPCKEYSIGRRSRPDPITGAYRFKQNSRTLRPGHRIKLFHLMRDMYLDELALAGGNGRRLLQRIKHDALRA